MAKRVTVQNRGGIRLREILDESGEEQQALEERLGLSRGYVGDAISGRARPSYKKRARFAVELRIPLHLWDEDAKTEKEAKS
jgi:transcriptional regulator with XRE-family HTH domain